MASYVEQSRKIDVAGSTSFVGLMLQTPAIWMARLKMRRNLSDISDHQLRDIGLARADIERESNKPFWQA